MRRLVKSIFLALTVAAILIALGNQAKNSPGISHIPPGRTVVVIIVPRDNTSLTQSPARTDQSCQYPFQDPDVKDIYYLQLSLTGILKQESAQNIERCTSLAKFPVLTKFNLEMAFLSKIP